MLRVRTVFSGVTGSPYLSTLYFNGLPASQAQADAAVAAVGTFWNALDNLFSNSLSWATDSEVRSMTIAGEVIGSYTTTSQTGTGADAAQRLPPSNQALIRWHTGVFVGGREIRGRTFVPGLTVSDVTAGQVSTATGTAIAAAAGALVADVNTELVVWSRKNAQLRAVTGGSAWVNLAVLRSRRD